MDTPRIYALCHVGLLVASLYAFWFARGRLRGLTLTATWWWTLLSLASVVAAEAMIGFFGSFREGEAEWVESLRFAALMATFCPMMSYMGAKRPQDGAWNFITLSLWGILVLPAAEAYFVSAGQTLVIHDARAWFLWILIFVGAFNLISTRYWLSALLIAGAQVAMLGEFLPGIREAFSLSASVRILVGVVAITTAMYVAVYVARFRPRSGQSLNRAWLDFRDTFGKLWGTRIADRINAAAEMYDWSVTLTWTGLRDRESGETVEVVPQEIEEAVRQTAKNLFRRFVSDEWLEERWPQNTIENEDSTIEK